MLQRNISESSLDTFRKIFFPRIKLAMTNLDSILKSRDITLLTKVHIVKFMVFPLVIYRCELDNKESWAPKNWCFQIVMLEKILQSPLDCKEIKPVNPEYSLEGLMLKLKLQSFGYLMWRADSLEKTLMFRKIKVRRRRKWQRIRWLDVITNWMIMNLSKLGVSEGQGSLVCYSL